MPPGYRSRFAALATSLIAIASPVVLICGAAAAARTAGLTRVPVERSAQAASATRHAAIASDTPAPTAVADSGQTQPARAGQPQSPAPTAAPPIFRPTGTSVATSGSPGCAWALAYLRANAAPGSALDCGGYALGHQAVTLRTCGPGGCAIRIVIHTVCEASVKNEAWNSLHPNGPIDPYGHC